MGYSDFPQREESLGDFGFVVVALAEEGFIFLSVEDEGEVSFVAVD